MQANEPGDELHEYRLERFESGRSRFVSAHFSDFDDAIEAARSLEERGYDREQISVFMSTDMRRHYIETRPEFAAGEEGDAVVESVELTEETKTMEGAGIGGTIGGSVGAVTAAVAAVGTTAVVPPLGIAVAGPLAAGLAGTGAGAAAGGLAGALVGAGMSEYRARRFQELLEDGRLIVGVEASTEAERTDVAEQLRRHGGALVAEDENE